MTVVSLLLAVALMDASPPVMATLPGGGRVVWQRGEDPAVRVLPQPGEGWYRLALRVTGEGAKAGALRQANPHLATPLRDLRVEVPWALLSEPLKVAALQALFPEDRRVAEGWRHRVRAPWGGDGESWLELARWFCGDERLYAKLREANPDLSLFTAAGDEVLIPNRLLLSGLRALPVDAPVRPPAPVLSTAAQVVAAPSPKPTSLAPAPPTPTQVPVPAHEVPPTATPELAAFPAVPPMFPPVSASPSVTPVLTPASEPVEEAGTPAVPTPTLAYTPPPTPPRSADPPARVVAEAGQGGRGELEYADGVAIYRLKPGEALYSAVVVRFTGQLHAADVNATAADLARLSGIADVTDIPIGYPVRIPFDLLLPEFLPPGHPRRREWERSQEEVAAIQRAIRARNLDGIHIILDAGHGGADSGAVVKGVWEATYAYDVMDRVRRVLEKETRATVWVTVSDLRHPRELEQDLLPQRRTQRLLVTPPYNLADSTTGVQLRWVLGNAILRRLKAQGVNPERVAFVSIHADSLHPAVRGLMVYVPGRQYRPAVGSPPPVGHPCRELTEAGQPRFSGRFLARAEALSRQLAAAVVAAARGAGVEVHPYEPVRPAVVRRGSRWVPAVLRNSEVPTALLVEICNLTNDNDRTLLLSWRFRDKLAHAIAAGLAEGFAR